MHKISRDGKVSREGFDLHYRVIGEEGPCLVVLAGGPGLDPGYMRPVADELSSKFRCILLEQRGTGRSTLKTYDTHTICFGAYLGDLEALGKHLGQEKLLLVGNSWGMMLALSFGGTYPERVEAIVTLGSGPTADEHAEAEEANLRRRLSPGEWETMASWGKQVGKDQSRAVYEIVRIAAPAYFFGRDRAGDFLCDVTQEQLNTEVALLGYDSAVFGAPDRFIRSRLSAVEAPVLLVHGRQDCVPEGCIVEAHQLIQGSKLELINECGHLPWFEQPEKTWKVVHEFLDASQK